MGPSSDRTEVEPPATTPLERITVLVVVALLSLVLGLVALAMPTRVDEQRVATYTQEGTFDYAAPAPAESVYGPDGLTSGQPVLLDVVGPVTFSFAYRLTSEQSSEVRGTVALDVSVEVADGLTRVLPLAGDARVVDGRAEISGVLPTDQVQELVRQAQDAEGSTGSRTTAVTVTPTVDVDGTLAGRSLVTQYAPELPFTLADGVLTPGQDQASGSVTDVPADPLRTSAEGELSYEVRVANRVPLLVADPTVLLARGLGLGLFVLFLLLGLWLARPLLRDGGGPGAERARVDTLYGSRIVEVTSVSFRDEPVAEVASIHALADLAKRYESAIMRVDDGAGLCYLVWDNGIVFRFRPPVDPESDG